LEVSGLWVCDDEPTIGARDDEDEGVAEITEGVDSTSHSAADGFISFELQIGVWMQQKIMMSTVRIMMKGTPSPTVSPTIKAMFFSPVAPVVVDLMTSVTLIVGIIGD